MASPLAPLWHLLLDLAGLVHRILGVRGLVVAFGLLAFGGYAGSHVLPVYVAHYTLHDEITALARMPVPEDVVRAHLSRVVAESRLMRYLSVEAFDIETLHQRRRISARYEVPVTILPGRTNVLRFAIDVDQPFFLEPDPIHF